MKKIRYTLVAIWGLFVLSLSAQQSENNYVGKSITLVVYGTANSEEEAIKTALRSAIEQAFGTFVSSNTTIVNDELTKDEIVSVASGNIENYSLISSTKDPDGKSSVSVKATVSIGKLLQFAQSKGATTELAGAAFTMNMKIRQLNKKNEDVALKHMYEKLLKICDLNLFDYTITTGDPHLVTGSTGFYSIPVTIGIIPNKNYQNLVNEFTHTIQALSLTETEAKEYKNANISTFKLFTLDYHPKLYGWEGGYYSSKTPRGIILRNDPFKYNIKGVDIFDVLQDKIVLSSCSFSIKDNLGNSSVPIKQTNITKKETLVEHKYNVKYNVNCNYPIFWKYEVKKKRGTITDRAGNKQNVNQVVDYRNIIYGITSSSNNPSKYFLGDKSEKKLDYYLFSKNNWNDFYYGLDDQYHKAFRDFRTELFKLDYGVSYHFEIRLYYTEKELSRVSSITIEPTNPTEIKSETFRIDN